MAKKTKMAGTGKILQDVLGLTVGSIAAAQVNRINLPLPAQIKPALPLVLGVFLMKQKGIVGTIGLGMIAAGGARTVGALVPALGIGAGEYISDYMIEGAEDYALAGPEEDASMLSQGESINATSYALAGNDDEYNIMGF